VSVGKIALFGKALVLALAFRALAIPIDREQVECNVRWGFKLSFYGWRKKTK